MAILFKARGKCSWFGGPYDEGVDSDEDLAFLYDTADAPELFLDEQPLGTTGLARRLDPEMFYVACRWDYDVTPKEMLADSGQLALVRAGGQEFLARPADWGPHIDTDRIADISPGLMEALGISTDDEIEVLYPAAEAEAEETEDEAEAEVTSMLKIAMSSGHGSKIQGAVGIINEVEEARRVVEQVADDLRRRGVICMTFHDDISDDQSENLNRIVDWHNDQARDLDISVHFNAFEPTDKNMGTEVLWVTQEYLAEDVAAAIAGAAELTNRGAKLRSDLYFLNQTNEPAILIEVCFVDSSADVEKYQDCFNAICDAIAGAVSGIDSAVPVA